jgi:TATA-box binding protein (TBP) (component of TFIID and TFIIIB)
MPPTATEYMDSLTINATPYRVSTITCNGSIGSRIDLTKLYDYIDVIDNEKQNKGFIYIIDRNGENVKGVNPRKKKNNVKKKDTEKKYRKFDNAISTYFKLHENYTPSVKIFKNGTIQMTGIKKIEEGECLHKDVFDIINNIYMKDNSIFENKPVFSEENFFVRMINSDFSVPYLIRRKELHKLIISNNYQNSCSFQPGTYPGVKLQYFWNPMIGTKNGICKCSAEKCFGKGNGSGHGKCKKVTVSIFESGKILITGATNFEQINEAYTYICDILKNNVDSIRKVYNF